MNSQRTGAGSSICNLRVLWNENTPQIVSSYSMDMLHNNQTMIYFLTTFSGAIVSTAKNQKIFLMQIRVLLKI